MSEQQLDLFADMDDRVAQGPSRSAGQPLSAKGMDDEELIAAIPESNLADSCILAAEAGRRGLPSAGSALAKLFRPFTAVGAPPSIFRPGSAIRWLPIIRGRRGG